MDIFSFITLFGGLALFLYGMNLMSQGLEKLAGSKLEGILKRMTSSPLKSLFLGIGITAVIQSSSAVTVMLVGLVNSGIMELSGTAGVIMGSNVGTTVTAWILSLVGIESDNVLVKLLKPESFSPVLALIGVILMMSAKTSKKKDIGSILIGFAILMYGMEFMSDSVSPLKDMPPVHFYSDCIYQSAAGNFNRARTDCGDSELLRVGGYSAGLILNRKHFLWHGDSDYHGSKHRYLCYCVNLQYRCK